MTWNAVQLAEAKQNPPEGMAWYNAALYPPDGSIGELNGTKIYYKGDTAEL